MKVKIVFMIKREVLSETLKIKGPDNESESGAYDEGESVI